MRNLISWKICESKFVKKIEIDLERVESLKKMALKRFEKVKKDKVFGVEVSFLVEDYYEIVKELLVAYLLKNGLKSQNHQCLISYLYKMHPELENEIGLISQMAFFRNRLGYYGENVPTDFYENKKEEFEHLIDVLLKLIK